MIRLTSPWVSLPPAVLPLPSTTIVTSGLALLLGLSACDTVAELSISQRDFRGASIDGVLNAASCAAGQSDLEVFLSFTPFDGDGVLIAPGEAVNNEIVTITGDRTFTEQDIRFASSFLYPAIDVPCTTDADCALPFGCVSINPFNLDGARQVCGMSTIVETLQRDLQYDEGFDEQAIAIVMDHSASLGGVNSGGGFAPALATDPIDQRLSGAVTFVLGYGRSSFADTTQMCVVSFGGEDLGGVRFIPTPMSCLNNDLSVVNTTLGGLGVGETGRSPLWAALQETITQQLSDTPGDRLVLLFTDGPDDSSVTADFQSVLDAALTNDVMVHIVHLENPQEADRVGPNDEFARLACETGGSYQYAGSPNDLRNYYDVLSDTVPASYAVQGQVIALSDATLPEGKYRLATGIEITLAGVQRTIQLAGDKTDAATQSVIDDRLVVFKRPVPPDPVDNTNGGTATGEGVE